MPVIQSDDRVWFDSQHKLSAICNEVQTASSTGSNVLLLSHFPATLSSLRRLLGETVKLVEFSQYDSFRLCSAAKGTIWVALARAFQPAAPTANATAGQAAPLRIVVTEHHPKQSWDQELITAAAGLTCAAEICFHFSLDDPLLEHFGGASIRKLFQKLGIEESECIQHSLVTASIRNAQEKIERQVPRDVQLSRSKIGSSTTCRKRRSISRGYTRISRGSEVI